MARFLVTYPPQVTWYKLISCTCCLQTQVQGCFYARGIPVLLHSHQFLIYYLFPTFSLDFEFVWGTTIGIFTVAELQDDALKSPIDVADNVASSEDVVAMVHGKLGSC
jgi:hypothetical protein